MVKAVLFDSGRVLNGPKTGHWFITPNFFEIIDKGKFYANSKEIINDAFKEAGTYINKQHTIINQTEEYEHFFKYYTILFEQLPGIAVDVDGIEAITNDLVYNRTKYGFFKDALKLIPRMAENYKLGVVSDAWPSLENVFKYAGMRDYFSTFIISSQLGTCKPDALMYTKALDELNIKPDEAVFIDDSIRNCDGAKQLGIKTILLCRDYLSYIYCKVRCKNQIIVHNLNRLDTVINNL